MNFSSKSEWTDELTRLKAFFNSTTLPTGPQQLDPATKILDMAAAVRTFTMRAEENIGNPIFQGTMVGLQQIEAYLKKQQLEVK